MIQRSGLTCRPHPPVLFVCVKNGGKSQMAAGLMRKIVLLAETQRLVALTTRQNRDDAVKPITKRMNLVASDLRLEISGAHMLTNNDAMHEALDAVTEAVVQIPLSINDYDNTMIMSGETPNAVPLYMAMEEVHRVVGDAIRMTGEMLMTGWDDDNG